MMRSEKVVSILLLGSKSRTLCLLGKHTATGLLVRCVLVRVAVAVIKHQGQKQAGEERVDLADISTL